MARVNITYFNVKYLAGESGVIDTSTISSEEIVSGGTSIATASGREGGSLCRVTTDGAIRLAFGTNPTAANPGYFMQQGASDLFWLPHNFKIAVIDA